MVLPFPLLNIGPLKVNVVQTGGLLNFSPINIPIGTNSHNKTNRLSDNFGDLATVPTTLSAMSDNDVLDFLVNSQELNIP